jgi:hypothetical protein
VQGAIKTLEFTNRKAVAIMTGFSMLDWRRCRVLLAELYREIGWASQAQEVEAEVRRLLSVADPNHPLLRRLPS